MKPFNLLIIAFYLLVLILMSLLDFDYFPMIKCLRLANPLTFYGVIIGTILLLLVFMPKFKKR